MEINNSIYLSIYVLTCKDYVRALEVAPISLLREGLR